MKRILYWGLFFLFSINGYAQTFKLRLFSMMQPKDLLSSDSIVLEYRNKRFYLNKRETAEYSETNFKNVYVLYGSMEDSEFVITSPDDTLNIYFLESAVKECKKRLKGIEGEFVDITKKRPTSVDPYRNSHLSHYSSSSHVSHVSHYSHYSSR